MRRLVLLSPDVRLQRDVARVIDGTGVALVAAADMTGALRLLDAENVIGLVAVLSALGDVRGDATRLADIAAPRPVFLLAADDDLSLAWELTASGVTDVLRLPLEEGELRHRLKAALGRERGRDHTSRARSRVVPQRKSDVLMGGSQPINDIRERIAMVAHTELPVAIYGESGTGKELAARMIHCESARRHGPFVVTNCTALPEDLFENELFGHERGSYTGAHARSGGLLEEASGGTLVFDEIGDLSLNLQAKLLRLIQFRTYRRVGGTRTLEADARIIVSTNVDLVRAVSEGRFRSDLYYRINVLEITMPPLRQHTEDLPVLVHHFASEFCRKYEREPATFTEAAIARLVAHRWTGNVRELESVVHAALALRRGDRIDAQDLRLVHMAPLPGSAAEPAPVDYDFEIGFAEARKNHVDAFEKGYLQALMLSCGGNVAAAARAASYDRKSFWRLLQKHEIDVEDIRSGKLKRIG